MTNLAISKDDETTIPVKSVSSGEMTADNERFSRYEISWARTNGFSGQSGRILTVGDANGDLSSVLFGIGKLPDPLATGALAAKLPKGNYKLEGDFGDQELAALGWMLGAYRFSAYNGSKPFEARLLLPDGVSKATIERQVEAVYLARDLINTPANDLGPAQLEEAVSKIGKRFKASVSVTKGDALLAENFPMIHAVGRASTEAPRLIDLQWGNEDNPKVTLVGKGVIFDSGGLNIKPGSSMALMKKDMGGAANTIALAQMIMDANLPVRLRLLVPAVENAISGNAFRPGDILPSRKGISVEIGNTDAEGRLILGDALALGDEEKPEIMIDMATLTGAARVALGPDLPPYYTNDEKLADDIDASSAAVLDPVWRMPLWPAYDKMLASKIADVNHISTGGFAGSITAALFLQRFVEHTRSWVHLDIYGWTPNAKPWAPLGGEAQAIRALFRVISERYGN